MNILSELFIHTIWLIFEGIEEWKLIKEKFKRNPEFSVAKYMGAAFQAERGKETVDVVIQFAPHAARYVREKHWHDSQQVVEQDDGGLILKLNTSGLGEVKRWVLQYGGDAEVIAPAKLREEIIKETKSMTKRYRKQITKK